MSTPKEDDLDALPEGEFLTLPDGAIPPGWLSEFFARRAAVVYQQESNELALELSGDSTLHLMIFRDMDPKEKRRRREEEDRLRLLAEQELRNIANTPTTCWRGSSRSSSLSRNTARRSRTTRSNCVTAAASTWTATNTATSRAGCWRAGTGTKPPRSTIRNPMPQRGRTGRRPSSKPMNSNA